MFTRRFILGVLVSALLAVAPIRGDDGGDGDGHHGPPTPPPAPSQWDGGYSANVTGFYSGKMHLRIQNGQMQMVPSRVVTPDHSSAIFHTLHPIAVDRGYFSGPAKMGNLDVTINGRIDFPAADENYPARITATFRVEDGHGGRIVGKLTP